MLLVRYAGFTHENVLEAVFIMCSILVTKTYYYLFFVDMVFSDFS